MNKSVQRSHSCPRCGTEMIRGCLRDSLDVVYIEAWQSPKGSSLQALICPDCGHVELQATHPEYLARCDVSQEELDDLFGEGKQEIYLE